MAAASNILILFKALGTAPVAASMAALSLAARGMSRAFQGAGSAATAGLRGIGAIAGAALGAARALGSLTAGGVRGLAGLGTEALRVGARISQLAVVAASAGAAIGTALVVRAVNADSDVTAMRNSLITVTGSAKDAQRELDQVLPRIDAMGLSIQKLGPAYAGFQAGASGTSLAGDGARDVFLKVADASRVMGLSVEKQQRVFTALTQVMGKGTLASEEIRGQIGEALPGAFNIAARAMGVTTQELGKMLQQGKVLSEDFLPKFANQLEKEFGNLEGAVDRPGNAFVRLQNVIYQAFAVIGRAGVSQLAVDALNKIRAAVQDLIDNGSLERWTKGTVSYLREAGKALGGVGRFFSEFRRQASAPFGDLIVSSFDPGANVQLIGRNTRAMARGYLDLFNILRAFSRDVGGQLAQAFGNLARSGSGAAGFLNGLNVTLYAVANTAVPLAIRGLSNLFGRLRSGATFAREFVAAFGNITNGLGVQLSFMLRLLGGVGGSVTGAFRVTPDALAFGIVQGVYRVNLALVSLVNGFRNAKRNFGEFMDGLRVRGTFDKIRQDASAAAREIGGIKIAPNLISTPDALAAAFDAAYRKISDKVAGTYAYLSKASDAFIRGVTFDPEKQFPSEGKARDEGFEGYAQTGRAFNQIGGVMATIATEILPKVAENFGKLAPPIAEAAANVFKLIDSFRQLVGDDAFAKILTLVLGLRLLKNIGLGGAVAGAAGGAGGGAAAGGLAGAVAAGIRAALPPILVGAGIGVAVGKGAEALIFDKMRPQEQKEISDRFAKGRELYAQGDYLGALKQVPGDLAALLRKDSPLKAQSREALLSPDGWLARVLAYLPNKIVGLVDKPIGFLGNRDLNAEMYDRSQRDRAVIDQYFAGVSPELIRKQFQAGSIVADRDYRARLDDQVNAGAMTPAQQEAYKTPKGMTGWDAAPRVIQIGNVKSPPARFESEDAVVSWTTQLSRELDGRAGNPLPSGF